MTDEGRYREILVACHNSIGFCDQPSNKDVGSVRAYVIDEPPYLRMINLCPVFFDSSYVIPTETALKECKLTNPNSGYWDQLYKYASLACK